MLLPALGFLIGLTIALLMARLALRFDRALRPNVGATLVFVASAFLGAILFTLAYTAVVADESNTLQSKAAVVGYFFGLLVTSASAGWGGAKVFVIVWSGLHRNS